MTYPCWNCGASAEPPLPCPPAPETGRGFARLRTGNEAPLDAEIPLIRDIISKEEARVETLESQIRNSKAALAKLVKRRDKAAEHLREHRAIVHPLRRAPPELICEIFACTLDSLDGVDIFSPAPPWYLGQICQSWRLWALAYPRLWCDITIPSPPRPSADPSVFEALLLRSFNALLNVSWTLEAKHPVNAQLAGLALAHCQRWGSLRLDLDSCVAAGVLDWLLPANGYLVSLKKLELLHASQCPIPDFLSVAPSLLRVLLTNRKLAYFSPDIQIPWHQITHYRGTYTVASQLEHLRAATKLEQCAISFETVDEDGNFVSTPGESSPIALPHLRRLYIERPQFLQRRLAAPLLEELYCLYMDNTDIPALLPFVHHSHNTLQKLVLMSYVPSTLITGLRGLPSLTYLLIATDNASADEQVELFDEMVIAHTSRDLCPNLSSLVYGINHTFLQEPFFAMIRSRICPSPLGSRLKYLRLFDPYYCSDIFSTTREFSDAGIDADVVTETEFALLGGKGFFS
ncbi:hypothetical protein DFH06DRAFT_1292485 [Mycena polygramma]|nr:hypothetical protein DFH06DRAFT_1292485 [Mycena polygramma]